ncbi:nucleotide exchange factor GrpE [Tumidithrix elongata RA019]|uniref:Protein GrpE n=1 Tax=Tumidithrix elongata BACA0141 TaxID=2716417 RepID=A0AAW9Q150_9CYAN|nr:nucleotide exchange factor GrpE [Tumidithrix elongata RA019]
MIDEENQLPDLDELVDDELDLEASLNQLAEKEERSEHKEAASPAKTDATEASNANNATKEKKQADASAEKIDGLMSEIITLKRQFEERSSQYTRLYADFENFRKRTEREKEETEDKINAKILKKFLPVVDDFERAQLQINPKTEAEALIHKSYQSVYKQLLKCLKEAGLLRMDVVGQEFDPNFHEAIAQSPSPEYNEGIVMDELRPGYLLGERVLRHALVKVSSGLESSPDAEPNPETEVGDQVDSLESTNS